MRRRPRIDQFHSGSSVGDAVTNGMLLTQKLLRQMGFKSEIYVQQVAEELRQTIKPHTAYRGSAQDLLLVHHSIGHDLAGWVTGLPARKVLVYHNITPPEFFFQGDPIRRFVELGRQQLSLLREAMVAAVANSSFTADELHALSYPNVHTLPLLFDVNALRSAPFEVFPPRYAPRPLTVLFVGRVVSNKCHADLLETLLHLRQLAGRPVRLVLVGAYEPQDSYFHKLQSTVQQRGLESEVTFTGKVPAATLYGLYRTADVFLCLSEHEGFGVPLVEAMVFGLPVIAFNSSAIPATLGGAGILLDRKDHREIAGLISVLDRDRPLRRAVVDGQDQRVAQLEPDQLAQGLVQLLGELGVSANPHTSAAPDQRTQVQVEGPFETSYSLAVLNRELARAMERSRPGATALLAAEGPGDYLPAAADLAKVPDLKPLWTRGRRGARPAVALRMLYPPRVSDMDGRINLFNFAWEESNVPEAWVDAFNTHLDGVVVISRFIRKVLQDAGVTRPIEVVGCGVDHLRRLKRERYGGGLGEGFRFLHVSSGFPRKGVDVLLRAWAAAFTSGDKVTLVIKTFPNVHNDVAQQLAVLRKEHPRLAPVVLIDEEVPAGQLLDLYLRAGAVVCPSRGEGFGLPLAEAMSLEIPVITTGHGGQTDFCTPETAWLVDYSFQASQSHMGLFNSVWVEPSWEDLARVLRRVASHPREVGLKVQRARALVQEQLTWEVSARRVEGLVEVLEQHPPLKPSKVRVGWVSTWNAKCGIATYSRYLLDQFPLAEFDVRIFASRQDSTLGPDDERVTRCWDNRNQPELEDLDSALQLAGCELVVFQFNFGFHDLRRWGALLDRLHQRGVRTVVTLHATKDNEELSLRQILPSLSGVSRILVHGVSDLNTLKGFGLVENVALFPHGAHLKPVRSVGDARASLGLPLDVPILASYGFLLPNKGVEELIEAFVLLKRRHPRALLLLVNALYPIDVSATLAARCRALIQQAGLSESVIMLTDFLAEEESLALLEAADLLVFPYQRTAESASGAIRFGLSAGRPILCTPLDIFRDVKDLTHQAAGTTPEALEGSILRLLDDDALLAEHQERQRAWLDAHSWPRMAKRLGGLIRALTLSDSPRGVDAQMDTRTELETG